VISGRVLQVPDRPIEYICVIPPINFRAGQQFVLIFRS
jgi:hypothetical protein